MVSQRSGSAVALLLPAIAKASKHLVTVGQFLYNYVLVSHNANIHPEPEWADGINHASSRRRLYSSSAG